MTNAPEFRCNQCGACCKDLDEEHAVLLLSEDIQNISEVIGNPITTFVSEYCEVSSALSQLTGHELLQLKKREGRCVFLAESNLCDIHKAKPYQCRYGPERLLGSEFGTEFECTKGTKLVDDPAIRSHFLEGLQNGYGRDLYAGAEDITHRESVETQRTSVRVRASIAF